MFASHEFKRLVNYLEEATGITLPESNYKQVKSYIEIVLKDLSLNLDQYFSFLENNSEEYNHFMQMVTINETYFFREEKHFYFLKDNYLSTYKKKDDKEDLNIWSASCSSGEEALSLYSLFKHLPGNLKKLNVYGSDISQEMINKFSTGIYRHSTFRKDGAPFHSYIKKIAKEQPDKTWKIDESHLMSLKKQKINLFTDSFDTLPMMDIIFLRNTLIYMNQTNKQIIIDRVTKKLKVGGILMLSASELPLIAHPALNIQEHNNCYFMQKNDPEKLSSQNLAVKISDALNRKNKTQRIEPVNSKIEEILNRKKYLQNGKESPPEKVAPIQECTVCHIIEKRLNNKLFIKSTPKLDKNADRIISLLHLIKENNLNQAHKLLMEKPFEPLSLHLYFKGYLNYLLENNTEAVPLLKRALKENTHLWPARYYLIKMLPENNPILKTELQILIEHIRQYILEHKYNYQFLLDGFNAQYFYMITKKKLSNLGKRGTDNGY